MKINKLDLFMLLLIINLSNLSIWSMNQKTLTLKKLSLIRITQEILIDYDHRDENKPYSITNYLLTRNIPIFFITEIYNTLILHFDKTHIFIEELLKANQEKNQTEFNYKLSILDELSYNSKLNISKYLIKLIKNKDENYQYYINIITELIKRYKNLSFYSNLLSKSNLENEDLKDINNIIIRNITNLLKEIEKENKTPLNENEISIIKIQALKLIEIFKQKNKDLLNNFLDTLEKDYFNKILSYIFEEYFIENLDSLDQNKFIKFIFKSNHYNRLYNLYKRISKKYPQLKQPIYNYLKSNTPQCLTPLTIYINQIFDKLLEIETKKIFIKINQESDWNLKEKIILDNFLYHYQHLGSNFLNEIIESLIYYIIDSDITIEKSYQYLCLINKIIDKSIINNTNYIIDDEDLQEIKEDLEKEIISFQKSI